MKIKFQVLPVLILTMALFHTAMANRGQYDEEARQQEKEERQKEKEEKAFEKSNPAKRFAGGVKQATVDSTTGLLSDTANGESEAPPVLGTLEGARQGSAKFLDNTVRGAVKVATLGYGDAGHYEVAEPEKGSGEPTKIKIKI